MGEKALYYCIWYLAHIISTSRTYEGGAGIVSISQIWELRLTELSEVTQPVNSRGGIRAQPQSRDFSAASTTDTLRLREFCTRGPYAEASV